MNRSESKGRLCADCLTFSQGTQSTIEVYSRENTEWDRSGDQAEYTSEARTISATVVPIMEATHIGILFCIETSLKTS